MCVGTQGLLGLVATNQPSCNNMLLQNGRSISKSMQNLANLLNSEKKLPTYSLEEVNRHDSFDDCWVIIFDNVYDVTELVQHHPGGDAVLLDAAGRDATLVFHAAGHGEEVMSRLEKYLVGSLPDEQKLFGCRQ